MPGEGMSEDEINPTQRLGWKAPIALAVLYTACVLGATYPAVKHFRRALPSRHLADPLVHIWTMKWYKTCFREGRLPFLCPEVQYPTGAPLGYLPPMQLQSLLFIPLSSVIPNDILCYNILWVFGFVTTGLGTFSLAWYVVRDRGCAALAGLLAMLSGPMTFFAAGELEQITLGGFPLFLVGWMRFVDRPTRGRFVTASGLYLLLAMCAPYYGIFGAFPAALYLSDRAIRARSWVWVRHRLPWFFGFSALVLPLVVALFANQVWAATHGWPMSRSDSEFDRYGASFWGYFVPMPPHLLCNVLPDFFTANGVAYRVISYLGVVTIIFAAYAAFQGVRFKNRGFWWACLAMVIVLSLGSYWTVGTRQIALPGYWLRKYFPLFRPIRVPGRFNLIAAVCAAVVAAAGLRQWLERIGGGVRRAVILAALMAVAMVDLAMVPFSSRVVPALPPCYAVIHAKDPHAVICDIPHFNAGTECAALSMYWESFHRSPTSAGYTATANAKHDALLTDASPFHTVRLAGTAYPSSPAPDSIDLIQSVRFEDYAWLYLTTHGFDYVVLHDRPGGSGELPVHVERLKAVMARAKVYEDGATAVFERSGLAPPERPVAVCTEGWDGRLMRHGRYTGRMKRVGSIAAYNPSPEKPLRVAIEMESSRRPRVVRLRAGGQEVAEWRILPGMPQLVLSPAFSMGAGLQGLKIETDGDDRPVSEPGVNVEPGAAPFSLWVTGIAIVPATDDEGQLARKTERPEQVNR